MSIAFLVFFKNFSCAKIQQKAHVSALYLGNPLVFCPKLPKILALFSVSSPRSLLKKIPPKNRRDQGNGLIICLQ